MERGSKINVLRLGDDEGNRTSFSFSKNRRTGICSIWFSAVYSEGLKAGDTIPPEKHKEKRPYLKLEIDSLESAKVLVSAANKIKRMHRNNWLDKLVGKWEQYRWKRYLEGKL